MKKIAEERLTKINFFLPKQVLAQMDKLITADYFVNRSEVVRTAIYLLLANFGINFEDIQSTNAGIFSSYQKLQIMRFAEKLLRDHGPKAVQKKMKRAGIPLPIHNLKQIDKNHYKKSVE